MGHEKFKTQNNSDLIKILRSNENKFALATAQKDQFMSLEGPCKWAFDYKQLLDEHVLDIG